MNRLLIILILFNVSCLEVSQLDEPSYVVEGYVYTGERVKDIKIKSLISLNDPDGESAIINDATVKLTIKGQTYDLIFNDQTGNYEDLVNEIDIIPQDELFLEVVVNNRKASALTIVPSQPTNMFLSKKEMVIPEIEGPADFITGDPLAEAEIIMNWDNPEKELHYVVIEFKSNLLRPILPSSIQEVVDGILDDFAIITPPDTVSSYTISGALLPSYGPYVAKLYKVNLEYADLYESEEQDSRDINDPPSNLINARGIFTAFAGDSLSFEIIKP